MERLADRSEVLRGEIVGGRGLAGLEHRGKRCMAREQGLRGSGRRRP
jgi:hypothetical protein